MKYLSPEQVLYIHHVLTEVAGFRDPGALESAVARPRSGFGDEEFDETVSEKAAALLHSLLDNHPFVDGNKRTAITAAGLFLEYKGRAFTATNEELEQFTRSVITEDPTVEETARWIQAHSRRLEEG
mgnify:CR=1 FL=1